MSADHAVFPLAECEANGPDDCGPWCWALTPGCLGDGRRVLLDQGVPVEPASVPWIEGEVGGTADVWVEVPV